MALAISNNSGTTRTAITRGNTVESVTQTNTRFPHWFARNYHRYNDAENALPVDQHMLLALMAPRLVYVASASGDVAADMRAEFRACVEAAPFFSFSKKKASGARSRRRPRHLVTRARSAITCAPGSTTNSLKIGAITWISPTAIGRPERIRRTSRIRTFGGRRSKSAR